MMKRLLLWGGLGLLTVGPAAGSGSLFLDSWLEFERDARTVAGGAIETDPVRREIEAAARGGCRPARRGRD